ncbi:MAG: flagellar hook-basal body complex protein FliE [Desulfobacteraceae bacterium]|nr:MAG: flagellar hook-basal body complex protein FliE [Desulfobacteraceae bacterium]
MTKIDRVNRISLHTEPVANRVERRDTRFSERIKGAVLDVNNKQHHADDAIEKVIKGEMGIHEGMMAIGKADTSLRLLNQVRSKAMAAYNEIIRMQV